MKRGSVKREREREEGGGEGAKGDKRQMVTLYVLLPTPTPLSASGAIANVRYEDGDGLLPALEERKRAKEGESEGGRGTFSSSPPTPL